MRQPSVYGRVSQISAIYLFLCVFYAILRCISFKIRVIFLIELLRIYKTMVLTSFFDFIQAPSMRISLILHLNFAHIKPQQPNPVILDTILGGNSIHYPGFWEFQKKSCTMLHFICNFSSFSHCTTQVSKSYLQFCSTYAI